MSRVKGRQTAHTATWNEQIAASALETCREGEHINAPRTRSAIGVPEGYLTRNGPDARSAAFSRRRQAFHSPDRRFERLVVWTHSGTPCGAVSVQARPAVRRDRGKEDSHRQSSTRRWSVGLVAGLVACGAFGGAPVKAQSAPVIVPRVSAIVVEISTAMPSLLVGFPGDNGVSSQSGLTWPITGRADVDVDIEVNRQHCQVAAR